MTSSWKYKNRIFSYITESQIPEIVEILHNPESEKYLWFAPISIEGFSEYSLPIIQKQKDAFADSKYPDSAIFNVMEDGKLLGACGINKMPDGHNVAMIGYQLKPSAWGKGTGTCCLEFLIHYAKTYLTVRKLFGDCMENNVASARVMQKCGFSFEGTIKEKYQIEGELHDNSWFGLRLADALPLRDVDIEPDREI